MEDGQLSSNDVLGSAVGHVSRNVADEAFLGPVVEHSLPKFTGLLEVDGLDL